MTQLVGEGAADVVVLDFGYPRTAPTLASLLKDYPGAYNVHHIDPDQAAAEYPDGISMTDLAQAYLVELDERSIAPAAVVGFCGGSMMSNLLVQAIEERGGDVVYVLVDPARPDAKSRYDNYRGFRDDLGRGDADLDDERQAPPDLATMLDRLADDLKRYTTARGMDTLEKDVFSGMMLQRYRAWLTYATMCFDVPPASRGADLCISSRVHPGGEHHRDVVRIDVAAHELFEDPAVADLIYRTINQRLVAAASLGGAAEVPEQGVDQDRQSPLAREEAGP